MHGHHLQEMVKLLLTNGAIDSKLRAVVKQLLGICDGRESSMFHAALDGSVRQSLKRIALTHPKEVWASVTKLLLTKG